MTLTLESVSYRYAGAARDSLRDVSLELADGEVVGLVGASEAGKTTICLVASGLAPRSIGGVLKGRVLIDGQPTADKPMYELAPHVGICFQNPATQLSQVTDTVFEEVAFGALNLGLARDDVINRVVQAMAEIGISDLGERDPRHLSGGQQQLVAICGLLAMQPGHLVLDEPVAQLDPEGRGLVADALKKLAAAGTGLLITEHDTDLLAGICSRVLVVDGGALVDSGAAAKVLGDPRLDDWGVEPPARVRLQRALKAAGVKAELPA